MALHEISDSGVFGNLQTDDVVSGLVYKSNHKQMPEDCFSSPKSPVVSDLTLLLTVWRFFESVFRYGPEDRCPRNFSSQLHSFMTTVVLP